MICQMRKKKEKKPKVKYIFEGREFQRRLTNEQKVVEHFINVALYEKNDKDFWNREIKFARELLAQYGVDLLLFAPPPEGYKQKSLMFLMTDFGKNYLSDQKFEYKKATTDLQQREEIKLTETKIGEDIAAVRKPRTLKEFLNFYGKGHN
jgi:hypothetical protein